MRIKFIFYLITLALTVSCKPETKTITIKNNLDIDRFFETIEITKSDLKFQNADNLYDFTIQDENGEQQVIQYEDTNGDGSVNMMLFQPKVAAKSSSTYKIVHIPNAELPESKEICYSRFVPERTDDYAWENDKVAFRVYGPTAQKMVEENIEGGTLSSGVDCWLKRVEYPIINKWYKKYTEKTGTYHEDTGEGLDNYHVGISRGCGGIAAKVETTYFVSKNFISYKTITNGPIRTQFTLKYADWDANNNKIKESRTITLDKGNNLSKFEINLEGINKISIGLTLHKNDGIITKNKENGWISYWEHLDDSELGTATVVEKPESILNFDTYISKTDDVKNQYIEIKNPNKRITYYAGFGWKKSNQFGNNQEWINYLNNFSKCINSPLEVSIQ